MKSSELRQNEARMRAGRMLQPVSTIAPDLNKAGVDTEDLSYFEIPLGAHKVGKMVVPFVAIDARGFLIGSLPHFYGVTKRPDTSDLDNVSVGRRSQEAHVVAEDMALRKGIFTPYGRATSEVFVSEHIPDIYREGYLQDRIAHLDTLLAEAGDERADLLGKQRSIVIEELSVSIDALRARLG